MEATAKLRYLRITPRKVRVVADLIRGKNVNGALAQLLVVVGERLDGEVGDPVRAHLLDALREAPRVVHGRASYEASTGCRNPVPDLPPGCRYAGGARSRILPIVS